MPTPKYHGRNMPIEATPGNDSVEARFTNPVMASIVGVAMQNLRFLPKGVKHLLQKRGVWEDVIQEIYTLCCEYWRNNKIRGFSADKNGKVVIPKCQYKRIMGFVGSGVYRIVIRYVPEWKRKYRVRQLPLDAIDLLPSEFRRGLPYVKDKDLQMAYASSTPDYPYKREDPTFHNRL